MDEEWATFSLQVLPHFEMSKKIASTSLWLYSGPHQPLFIDSDPAHPLSKSHGPPFANILGDF